MYWHSEGSFSQIVYYLCYLIRFKCNLYAAVEEFPLRNQGRIPEKRDVAAICKECMSKSLTPENCAKSFELSGIVPFNPSKVLDKIPGTNTKPLLQKYVLLQNSTYQNVDARTKRKLVRDGVELESIYPTAVFLSDIFEPSPKRQKLSIKDSIVPEYGLFTSSETLAELRLQKEIEVEIAEEKARKKIEKKNKKKSKGKRKARKRQRSLSPCSCSDSDYVCP
jgi:hypothetical protein